MATLFAAGLVTCLSSTSNAQYYPDCSFPLNWPFCIAGTAVNAAATIATAPFYAVAGGPYYYYYGRPYYYHAGYYYPVRHYKRTHHKNTN